MGDYSRARKIYSASPLACIRTLEPVHVGHPVHVDEISRHHTSKIQMKYNVDVPEFDILLLFTETQFHEFSARML
jgi:hypothetical protein